MNAFVTKLCLRRRSSAKLGLSHLVVAGENTQIRFCRRRNCLVSTLIISEDSLWDKTLKQNQFIKLEEVPKDFEDVARWIQSSRISFVVQTEVLIYRIHIQEFWQTAKAETVNKIRRISATVCNKEVIVTEERIRTVLKLGDNVEDPINLNKDNILDGFRGMGYVGDFSQKKEIKRNGLTRDWRFIVRVIAMSLAHRKGGYDGFNLEWSGAMLNLCLNQKFNLSGLIFNYMLENARGHTWAMYPRFIQMLINAQYSTLPHDGGLYTFHVPPVDNIYRDQNERMALKAKQQRDVQVVEEVEVEEEEQLKRKRKGRQTADEEPPKKKKSSENPEKRMGASFRATDLEDRRRHIQDMGEIDAMEERQKREKKLARREMSESERPVVVTEEEQALEDFVDTLLTDPEETSASKSTLPKKKSTDEGPCRFLQVKPTRISKPPVPPQRIRPFQELYDKIVKEIGATPVKETCLLKNQVNDTNILREKLQDQR
ncbi:hypothetical protein Hanom_Chr02g00156171 [Helianthus anomalus]